MINKEWIEKHQWRLLLALLLPAAYLRFAGLGELPPFIDESGHLMLLNPIHPTFYSLGKVLGQYLYRPVVAMASDGLYAVRMLMALLGVGTVVGVFCTARLLGGAAAGLLAAALWALQPIVTFHDRLAIHDPMISLFHIWSICLLILALRGGDIRLAAGAGLLSGLGVLVKMPLAPLVGSCVVIGMLSIPRERWAGQTKVLLGFVGGLAAAMLILVPNLDKMFQKDTVYALGIGATERSAALFGRNLSLVGEWLAGYNSMVFVVAALGCVGLAIYRKDPLRIALAVLFAAPVVAMSWTLSVFYARYILATLLPLTLLMGLTLPEIVLGDEEESHG